jgi:hypothetical protein
VDKEKDDTPEDLNRSRPIVPASTPPFATGFLVTYFETTSSNSTSKTNVAPGLITGGDPRSP